MRFACGVALVVACGGNAATPDAWPADSSSPDSSLPDSPVDAIETPGGTYGAVSGTRLKITWLEVDGGARVFKELFDAERGEACRIEPATGGAIYCAPPSQAQIAYSDASCTQPVMRAPAASDCGTPARYAHESSSDPCGSSTLTHLRAVGPPIARVPRIWTLVNGQCGGGRTETPGFDYFALGEEVALDQLARLTLAQPVGPGAARLQQRSYESSDGLHLPLVAHDAMLDIACVPSSEVSASTRCVPYGTFGDVGPISWESSCDARLATIHKTCPAPAYAFQRNE